MKKITYALELILIFLCLIAFWGGLVYRVYALNAFGLAAALLLAVISLSLIEYFYLISRKKTRQTALDEAPEEPFKTALRARVLVGALYLMLMAGCFFILFKHRTAGAIISPWQVVPGYFFLFYGLASLTLAALVIINKKIILPFLMLHYFLSFSVAVIVYRLGYGYDPFIHQATEALIAQTGAVEPKPFYYLGQYALTVTLHKITTLPLIWLDRLLLPLAAAVALPLVLRRTLNRWLDFRRLNLLVILALPLLTFPFLIVTTPQNLAYLLLILVILLSLVCRDQYDYLLLLLLALTATITQPVAGLPALLLTAFLAVYHGDRPRLKKYLYPLLTALTVFVLPALFYLLNKQNPAGEAGAAGGLLDWLNLSPAGQSNFVLNFTYFYGYNFAIFLGLLALAGAVVAWRNRRHCRILFLHLTMAAALILAYLLTAKLPFTFLINYERGDYAERLLLTAALFLLPFYLLAVYSLFQALVKQKLFFKLAFALFFVLILTASLYLSYPRYDDYHNSRGYSVSLSDIEAVAWIQENAPADYLVLSNQQVAVAALSRYGFKKYYQTPAGEIFYYPIPTGSPLYAYYLDMAYNKKPDRAIMAEAMALAGVKEAYFVLNKYWFDFKKTLAEAKLSADTWREFGDGQVYVFKYSR